jgi:hypothetical protein
MFASNIRKLMDNEIDQVAGGGLLDEINVLHTSVNCDIAGLENVSRDLTFIEHAII